MPEGLWGVLRSLKVGECTTKADGASRQVGWALNTDSVSPTRGTAGKRGQSVFPVLNNNSPHLLMSRNFLVKLLTFVNTKLEIAPGGEDAHPAVCGERNYNTSFI